VFILKFEVVTIISSYVRYTEIIQNYFEEMYVTTLLHSVSNRSITMETYFLSLNSNVDVCSRNLSPRNNSYYFISCT
jgi:hypothetical protein